MKQTKSIFHLSYKNLYIFKDLHLQRQNDLNQGTYPSHGITEQTLTLVRQYSRTLLVAFVTQQDKIVAFFHFTNKI